MREQKMTDCTELRPFSSRSTVALETPAAVARSRIIILLRIASIHHITSSSVIFLM